MKRKGNYCHYEKALESFLRKKKILYLAINEAKRPLFRNERVKNFDFLLITKKKELLLCDVKGKFFPYEYGKSKNYWENWITKDDLKYLELWDKEFGKKAIGIILYIYWIKKEEDKKWFKDIYEYKRKRYAFVTIDWKTYKKYMKPRSKTGEGKYNAIAMPRREFSRLVKPLSFYLK